MKTKEVIKLLEANGWVQVRMRGDHRQFKNSSNKKIITVSGSINDDMPIGTQKHILKDAGLT
ncbi:MAG: type II toxin-antitoxin system HicA family toxin [Bacteroidaceae bacterium]|nr:type II toxin-antitoxin system HicA family toxin [Bacteroidaceae bacterium]